MRFILSAILLTLSVLAAANPTVDEEARQLSSSLISFPPFLSLPVVHYRGL